MSDEAHRCRCWWRGEQCNRTMTQEDLLCDWCGPRDFPVGGGGSNHDVDPAKPASTPACWYPGSDSEVRP